MAKQVKSKRSSTNKNRNRTKRSRSKSPNKSNKEATKVNQLKSKGNSLSRKRSTDSSYSKYNHGIVKVLAQRVQFNWILPFQIRDAGISTGSGFFISPEGHIITCAHVIRGAMEVEVEISSEGRTRFPVEVLGVCFHQDYDMALLRIKGYKPKHYFELGNSDQIRTGDKVRAIGFPLGSNQLKVTQGIVSGRENGSIQTDTALNPGNSGGPLVDEQSKLVIGINYQLLRGANAMGYAVPINHYFLIQNQLNVKGGTRNLVHRPMMGFDFHNVSKSSIEISGSTCSKGGIYVSRVYPNSPIEQAGIKSGNIICAINGYQIDQYAQISVRPNEQSPVTDVIHTIKNGGKVPIVYWNGNKQIKTQVKYDDYLLPIRARYPSYEKVDYEVFGGMVVMNLSLNHVVVIGSKLMKYSKPKDRFQPRLVLANILPGSDLYKQEILSAGDIITKVNDKEVNSVDHFRKAALHPLTKNGKYYLKIETKDHESVILNLNKLLESESMLVKMYKYSPSKTFSTIVQTINKSDSKDEPIKIISPVKSQTGGGQLFMIESEQFKLL